jgi:hypothetical protein
VVGWHVHQSPTHTTSFFTTPDRRTLQVIVWRSLFRWGLAKVKNGLALSMIHASMLTPPHPHLSLAPPCKAGLASNKTKYLPMSLFNLWHQGPLSGLTTWFCGSALVLPLTLAHAARFVWLVLFVLVWWATRVAFGLEQKWAAASTPSPSLRCSSS